MDGAAGIVGRSLHGRCRADEEDLAVEQALGHRLARAGENAREGLARDAHALRRGILIQEFAVHEPNRFQLVEADGDDRLVARGAADGPETAAVEPAADAAGQGWSRHRYEHMLITMARQSEPVRRLIPSAAAHTGAMAEAPDPVQRTILDSITDGVFTVDADWRITFFNRAAQRITGVPRESAIGRRCAEVFRASICESACALAQTIQSGRPIVNKVVYIVDAAGTRIPISVSTAVLHDEAGRFAGGVETFRDLRQVTELRKALEARYSFHDIVGRSAAMREIFEILPVVAPHDTTVLIEGESGTGKELVARAIHDLSRRQRLPFVAVNCGAIPETLLESELFGYRAGAFTDARRDKPGRFAVARGGTLFLDEVGDITLGMQAKLLRVLQEREFEPLGATAPVRADVRILAATHRDLDTMVKQGAFREDLYFRLNVFRITIPPLRDRREDVPLLADHLLAKVASIHGKDLGGFSEDALRRLLEYDYPGNVRELENAIEHAAILCQDGLIHARDLPASFRAAAAGTAEAHSNRAPASLRELELLAITDSLRRHGGNRTAAARALGIDPSTLYRRLKAARVPLPRIPRPRR
jgi:PAS domain S-box-containing protein